MSFKDARLNQKVLFMMILLLLLVVAVVALTLERNEGPGGLKDLKKQSAKVI